MCRLVSHKSTEITRRRRRILDSQSSVQSPLRQVSDGAINSCHAYLTMTGAAGVWKAVLLFNQFNQKFVICTYQEFNS